MVFSGLHDSGVVVSGVLPLVDMLGGGSFRSIVASLTRGWNIRTREGSASPVVDETGGADTRLR